MQKFSITNFHILILAPVDLTTFGLRFASKRLFSLLSKKVLTPFSQTAKISRAILIFKFKILWLKENLIVVSLM